MSISTDHFKGCHTEDKYGPDTQPGDIAQDIEPCWHCSTPTDLGCYCLDCAENSWCVPSGYVYHCKLCDRSWYYELGMNPTAHELLALSE